MEIKIIDHRPPESFELDGLARAWRAILFDLLNQGLSRAEAQTRAAAFSPGLWRLVCLSDALQGIQFNERTISHANNANDGA